jgi:chlorobactene glucosyltransferase
VAVAQAQGLDMLSLEPFLELGSFWERLIIPAGLFAIACALDVSRTSDPEAATASVNGQFLLVRRDVYFAVGGHEAVRAEIAEDSALALRVKQAGHRLGLYGADRLIRVRMYDGLGALWEGLSKNVTEIFGGAMPTLRIAAGGLVLGWATLIVPAGVALAAPPVATLPASVAFMVAMSGSLTVMATQIAGAYHFRIPWWYGLFFPLGFTAASMLAVNGVLMRARGRVAWKGRVYSVPQRATRSNS